MDKSELQGIVDKYSHRMILMLGLSGWQVSWTIKPLGEGSSGQCHHWNDYKYAEITLDPEKAKTKIGAFRLMLHELLHCCLGEFTRLKNTTEAALESNGQALTFFTNWMLSAVEKSVTHFEIMLEADGFFDRLEAAVELPNTTA